MDIAFCINRLGMIGLGATLTSLIRNCSDSSRLNIYVLCADLSTSDRQEIINLVKSECASTKLTLLTFDPVSVFGNFAALHGDWTTYGRLLLVDLIPAERVLYLDADLIIKLDVLELADFDLGKSILAAVGGGKFKHALGHRFYLDTVHISGDTEYFNAGVMLLNLSQWRKSNIKNKCFELAKQYAAILPSHDQSLLNIISKGAFTKLPSNYNCEWVSEMTRPARSSDVILHFVGSPKPWDLFGLLFHYGYESWQGYHTKTWKKYTDKFGYSSIRRAWNIRRSYARTLRHRWTDTYQRISGIRNL